MIKIMDTSGQIAGLFDDTGFCCDKWRAYINSIYEDSSHIFEEEVKAYIDSGQYTWEKDFLPVINAVRSNPALDVLRQSFVVVTDELNQRVAEKFGGELDIDVVLYLGLCNAAGWVTSINGNDTVLLGVEKILELGWQGIHAMYGLLYHELGHAYHAQHGAFREDMPEESAPGQGVSGQSADERRNRFIWQLFTEGIAMYFEQALVGDFSYYHQDIGGWRDWCEAHFAQILSDFNRDIETATQYDQRYFGDWCDYCGHSDVGYYLGTEFVHHLRKTYPFAELLWLDKQTVCNLYAEFAQISQAGCK